MTSPTSAPTPGATEDVVAELRSDNTSTGVEADVRTEIVGEAITEPFNPELIDVKTRNPTIDLLLRRINEGEIDLMPDFQRRAGIWDKTRMSRLVESLLLRIPLPVFYFSADSKDRWAVVDGLQRLTTLKQYALDGSFALENLEFLLQYEGMRFNDLPRTMQRRVNESEITVHIIQPGTPGAVMFNIFKRINTGGMPLSAQEIRHAIFQGTATRFLRELAESTEFRVATDYSIRDERMADRECVLRFVAFYMMEPRNYRQDLDTFLSEAMQLLNKSTDQTLADLRSAFLATMTLARQLFGRYAFRKLYGPGLWRNPINKALFEAWSVNLAKLNSAEATVLIQKRDPVLQGFYQLMRDPAFSDAISISTGDPRKVAYRFAKIDELVRGAVNAP
jgi:hypothetical protein